MAHSFRCGHAEERAAVSLGPDAHPFSLPGSTTHYAASRPLRVERVKLSVELDFAERSLEGACETTLRAVRKLSTVTFDAAPEIEASKITVDGKRAEFSSSGEALQIVLPRVVEADAVFTVRIDYRCQPSRGLYFHGPDEHYPDRPVQVWTQGQDEDARSWFPCLDAPAQKAPTELTATFPAKMTALSNGELVSDEKSGAKRTMTFRLDRPHSPYLVTLVVGEFETLSEKAGKTTLRTLYPKGRRADAKRCVDRTAQMLALFERLFGTPYPWGSYSQVFVTEFIFGGMENTSATTLTDWALHDAKAAADFSAEPLVAHELAHQWFGDLLTCRDWPHGWLNEGFATYAEVLWKEHADSLDEADQQRAEDLEGYLGEVKSRYARAIVSRQFHEPIDLFDRHLYEKGGLVLHELRRRLGDELFYKALRHYVAKHADGAVETVDLARAIEDATGHNPDRFFDQYVFAPGHPSLDVTVRYSAEEKRVELRVKQTQKPDGAVSAYHLPLPVEVETKGGVEVHSLSLADREHVFFLPCGEAPKSVRVDPRREVFCTLKVEKPSAYWTHDLAHAAHARSRAEAAAALGKAGNRAAVEALSKALPKEKFWGAAAAIGKALGQARTPLAKAALLDAGLSLKHPKARRGAVRALGEFRRDEEVAKALRKLCAKGDASYFVHAEAARSLGKLKLEDGKLLRGLLKVESFQDVVKAAALDALVESQDASAFELARKLTRYGVSQYTRRAAMLAVAGLAEVAERKLDAVHTLEDLLRDPQFRVLMTAFEAAQRLGDRRILPAIESTPFSDGRAKRAARETVRSLREGEASKKELAALREEVDRLKEQTKAIREELEGRKGR